MRDKWDIADGRWMLPAAAETPGPYRVTVPAREALEGKGFTCIDRASGTVDIHPGQTGVHAWPPLEIVSIQGTYPWCTGIRRRDEPPFPGEIESLEETVEEMK